MLLLLPRRLLRLDHAVGIGRDICGRVDPITFLDIQEHHQLQRLCNTEGFACTTDLSAFDMELSIGEGGVPGAHSPLHGRRVFFILIISYHHTLAFTIHEKHRTERTTRPETCAFLCTHSWTSGPTTERLTT